jgi:hypothetical protein|tara:strand:- start:147 stop:425 length:279 start_codon:yes stop_codon:yes gene_type:complete
MTREEILDFIEEIMPGEVDDIVLAEGICDSAFMGLDTEVPRAIYSTELCLYELAKTMSAKSAEDYFNERIYQTELSPIGGGLCPPLFITTPV